MNADVAFPVRLADMREAHARHAAASEAERAAMHDALTFFNLLTIGEQAALERRFPAELATEPTDPDAGPEDRRDWDTRAHDLIRCMLAFGDEVLARHMDLVGHVAPDQRVAILALTATGSMVALGLPDAEQLRSFEYRPSPRADRGAMSGTLLLKEPVTLGDRLRLQRRNTSEVIVLAAGTAA